MATRPIGTAALFVSTRARYIAGRNGVKRTYCFIYELEESSDVRALVMELVEGPTPTDRIAQGLVPLDEALALVQPADPLAFSGVALLLLGGDGGELAAGAVKKPLTSDC